MMVEESGAAAALRALRDDDDLPTADIPLASATIYDDPAPETVGGSGPGDGAVGAQAGDVGALAGGTAGATVGGEMEWVTCPECGTAASIDPAQRRAEDFCSNCDFPLFWARASVVALSSDETGASLRRLPGTVGRAAAASVACPHCGEPNSPIAEFCVRCDLPMVIVAPPEPEPEPEPEPVVLFEPEPEPDEPDHATLILLVCTAAVLALFLFALYLQ